LNVIKVVFNKRDVIADWLSIHLSPDDTY